MQDSPPETHELIDGSVCFNYITRIYSVTRDAGTERKSESRHRKEVQTIHDPKKVRKLHALKQEAYRACRNAGTKLEALGFWLVPKDNEDELWQSLSGVSGQWDEFVADQLVPNYLDWVSAHAHKHPGESLDIIRLAPSLDQVKRSTRFVFGRLKLQADQIEAVNLDQEFESLPEQALHDIAQEFREAGLDKSSYYTQCTRQILVRIVRKARALARLHPRLDELARVIDSILPQLPTSGSIRNADHLAVQGVVRAVLDERGFLQRGFGLPASSQAAPVESAMLQPVAPPTSGPVPRILVGHQQVRARAARIVGEQPATNDEAPCDGVDQANGIGQVARQQAWHW